jgi:uncharacterized protein YydD (DUF2326 family)
LTGAFLDEDERRKVVLGFGVGGGCGFLLEGAIEFMYVQKIKRARFLFEAQQLFDNANINLNREIQHY